MQPWKISSEILISYAAKYKSAARRSEKGQIIRQFMELTGIKSRHTATGKLQAAIAGERPFDELAKGVQKRKSRKNTALRLKEKEEAMKIVSLKLTPGVNARYGMSTGMAVNILTSAGQLTLNRSESQWNRIIKFHGLEFKAFKRQPVAQKLTSPYCNHVFVVDATPINQYYMDLRGNIVPFDAPPGDTHLEDELQKRGYSKIWVFAGIDMHSKTFMIRPFAEPAKDGNRVFGERAEVWLKFLEWSFMPKLESPLEGYPSPLADCPMFGLPDILFCDRGSGIGNSNAVNTFCRALGIEVRTHLPGHPNAKGIIESAIGAWKRSVEVGLSKHVIQDINQLIYFFWAHAAERNRKRGYYEAFQKSALDHPLRLVDEEDFKNAKSPMTERVISGFGTVSISKQEWFVTADEQFVGKRVNIYRVKSKHGEFRYTAEYVHPESGSRITFEMTDAKSHDFDNIKSFPDTDAQLNRKTVLKIAKDVQRMMEFDDYLPENFKRGGSGSGVSLFPSPSKPAETVGAVPPEQFKSVQKARLWIMTRTGLLDGEMEAIEENLAENTNAALEKTHLALGYIPGILAQTIVNGINEKKLKLYKQYFAGTAEE